MRSYPDQISPQFDSKHCILSTREFEIYKAIASDKTISDIAKEMSISEKSVHNALYKIREKTGLKRTTQIAKDAQTRGIVK